MSAMAASNVVRLPNGQNLTVHPVFGGLFFKSNELSLHNSVFPAGWTIIIHSEDDDLHNAINGDDEPLPPRRFHNHRYKQPTLNNDHLFITNISNPSSADFKPPASPTRQIAMMLYTTLFWYFHQTEPSKRITTKASKNTPEEGKPKGEWRVHIKREGIFKGRNLLHKLERMGLVASEDSTVGIADDKSPEGWQEMFVSQRSFWQLSAKLFLYTLAPTGGPLFGGSPYGSRPTSPVRPTEKAETREIGPGIVSSGLWTPATPGPFSSGSHLPTYYPPPPPQYTLTNGARHPVRPKPPRQGETFYIRYIPSIGQYLSFRVASICDKAVAYTGPRSIGPGSNPNLLSALPTHVSPRNTKETGVTAPIAPTSHSGPRTPTDEDPDTVFMTDIQLLNKWMNLPRVSKFWGTSGPIAVQETFLKNALKSKHSFPVIGCWDGAPFGYFEMYWVKEDLLGSLLGDTEVYDYDRGVHVLVGEEEFRGPARVKAWMSSLAHWVWQTDYRTNNFVLEPRVDNSTFIKHLENTGFSKEKEVSFPHKQAYFMRLRREAWDGPAL